MNLKEAFRFQNKLNVLTGEAIAILNRDANITETKNIYHRSKVVSDAQDAVIVEAAPSEFADRISEMVRFAVFLLEERSRLFQAIHDAKAALDIDFDSEASLNTARHNLAAVFRTMAGIQSSETVIPNGGYGYRFNAEGNQVLYKCDMTKVTTIHFDRNLVRSISNRLSKEADAVSTKLDMALINSTVAYDAPFDVNDTFRDVFTAFCEQ